MERLGHWISTKHQTTVLFNREFPPGFPEAHWCEPPSPVTRAFCSGRSLGSFIDGHLDKYDFLLVSHLITFPNIAGNL